MFAELLMPPKGLNPCSQKMKSRAPHSNSRDFTRKQIPAGKGEIPVDGFSLKKILSNNRPCIRGNLIPWVMRGGLAIFDQGILTGSNFVIGIVLARWLPRQQYGTFAVAFAVFLLLVMLYQGLMLEPMLVFGGSAYRTCLRGYLKALLLLHLAITLPMVLVLCVSAGVVFKLGLANGLPGTLVGVAFAAPFFLLFGLARRTFYLNFSPAPSAGGGLLYCALTIGALTLVYEHGLLSPPSAFLVMGLGGLGASVLLLIYLGLRLPSGRDAASLPEIWRRHWRYGRWAIGANVMMWVPVNIYYPLLSGFGGMTRAGELKALMNFASPVLQTCAALYPLMLPYAARVLEERGGAGVSFVLRRMTALCVSCAVLYWLVLLVFEGPAFRILYSGRYMNVAYLLPIVALASVLGSAFFGPAIALRSMECPGLVFAAVSASSCISVVVGVPLTRALGVGGATWGMAVSEALAFVAAVVLVRRKAHRFSELAPAIPVAPAGE